MEYKWDFQQTNLEFEESKASHLLNSAEAKEDSEIETGG